MKKELPSDICRKCTYYLQHYVFVEGNYRWAYLGHCVRPPHKARKPDAKACEHYEEKQSETTKEK